MKPGQKNNLDWNKHVKGDVKPQFESSYWCPTDSCWIPVIPADSSMIPVEFTSQNLEILILQYLHWNSPQNGLEQNGTGMHDWNGC